jgi:hypothetical protein
MVDDDEDEDEDGDDVSEAASSTSAPDVTSCSSTRAGTVVEDREGAATETSVVAVGNASSLPVHADAATTSTATRIRRR